MAIQHNRSFAITLIFSLVILLALAPPSSANTVAQDAFYRRDHVNLNRMIKRRAPFAPLPRQHIPAPEVGAVGAAADPPADSPSSPVPSSTPAAPSATPAQESSQSPQPISSVVSSALSSATPSVSSTPSQSSATPTSSTTPTSTTKSPTPTSSPLSVLIAPTPTSQADQQQTAAKGQSLSVDSVTLTSHAPAATSSSADSSQIGGSSLSHSAITILIIIAASIGGCVVVWTIIRKWKFRPSAQFEDRLEPVDWQPAEHDSGLPIRRMPSNASSFHSGGHDNMLGLSRSDSGVGYNAARNLTPIPDHDFTAGPAVPVGGYADLARGPSPQPQMMQEALQRGPSVNRGYENYQGGNGVQEAYDYNNPGPRY